MTIVSTAVRTIATRLVLCVAMIASVLPAAWAQGPHGGRGGMPRGGGGGEARAARQAERAQQRAVRNGPREAPQRPIEVPPPQPAPPVVPEAAQPGRPGRLTPDERRALRQQINEAGRDVYRPYRP